MKKTLLLTILLAVAATAAANTADEAAALYSQSRYGEALDLYLGLLGEGYGTAELYYNIGNTYYRMDSLGRAILFYRRALALKPGMDDARQNLALAESRTVDRITPLPRPFMQEPPRSPVMSPSSHRCWWPAYPSWPCCCCCCCCFSTSTSR